MWICGIEEKVQKRGEKELRGVGGLNDWGFEEFGVLVLVWEVEELRCGVGEGVYGR